jgi:pyrroloquinoline-quinone synthase
MNEGNLSRVQIQLWAANRFYYQNHIPIKDALLLARCPLREVRRRWVQRIHDHDGWQDDPGGIEKWLRLCDAVGVSRQDLKTDRLLLPAVRFAVDGYVHFVGSRPWVEGVASSLTELFAPALMTQRLAAFEKYYTWIDPKALDYFRSRPPLATRDSEHALDLVLTHCVSRQEQERAVAALRFKCELLCCQLDALYYHCVVQERKEPA